MAVRSGPGNLLELQEDEQLALLVKGWNFQWGKDFEAFIFSRFKSPVHHPSSSSHGAFHLLAVFRRFTLHSVLGGSPADFHVTFLRDRHFRFSVSTKHVGFEVGDLKRVISDHFDVYFHLWRDGGEIGSENGTNGKRKKMHFGITSLDDILSPKCINRLLSPRS
jgi:hypothetical protein